MLAFGAVFALGLWAGRLRFTCPHRFEFRVDHCSWDGLLDCINDYGFIGGFGRPSRQLGRLRSGFLGARSACTRLDCLLLGLCLHGDAVRYFLGARFGPRGLG
jgi:hypothetical protein